MSKEHRLAEPLARRLSACLDDLEAARAEMSAARLGGREEPLLEATDRYLEVRDRMGETMKAVGEQDAGSG